MISALSRATIGFGVAGRHQHAVPRERLEARDSPLSAIVGRSGSSGKRFAVVTAIARSLPAWICGCSGCITAKIICVSPWIVDVTAGGEPLNGTCTTSMPASDFRSSIVRCDELPLPTDA